MRLWVGVGDAAPLSPFSLGLVFTSLDIKYTVPLPWPATHIAYSMSCLWLMRLLSICCFKSAVPFANGKQTEP